MKKVLRIIAFLLIVALTFGCSKNTPKKEEKLLPDEIIDSNNKQVELNDDELEPEKDKEIDLEKIKPNENGQIMVLMYHGISEQESEWVRTIENFKKDLKILYENGYRLISMNEYIDNNIDVEAGYTPLVMTFDDGLQNQFNYIDIDGIRSIDPNCAIGILEEFCSENPDFGRAATFYVYYPIPFRQKDYIYDKFNFLIANGYEIGNHGYNHENLSTISVEKVQESLALNAKNTETVLKGYKVNSLALPYGASPKGENYKYVVSGEFDGYSYNNKAILKVGSNPAYSPNHIKFDFSRIPRVRASEMKVNGTGLYDYLEYFEKNPDKKYISDGDSNTITIPEKELENINSESIKNKKLVTYNPVDFKQ